MMVSGVTMVTTSESSVAQDLALRCQTSALIVVQAESSATQLLFQDAILLAEEVDHGVLVLADPACCGYNQDLPWAEELRHSPNADSS